MAGADKNMETKKPFDILIIRNSLEGYDLSDDLKKFSEWMEKYTPLVPVFTYLDTDLMGLQHKPFSVDAAGKTWFGLSNIKEALLRTGKIHRNAYKAIVFVYDFKDTSYPTGEGYTRAGGWCYFNLFEGAAFIEIPALDNLDPVDDYYRVLSHEIIHAFHRILWSLGVNTKDDMDLYDYEFIIDAPTGNRLRNLDRISPYWPTLWKEPLMRTILKLLSSLIPQLGDLIKKIEDAHKVEFEKPRNRIEEWADATEEYEGFFPGSRSFRNHNPGNIKASPFTNKYDPDGFCIFPSYDIGRKALIHQLTIACDGRSKVYKPEDTLFDFYRKYAPAFDNNEPNSYAEFVAKKIGVKPIVQIKTLLA